MKRTLSFLLACLLVLGMFPVQAYAQETEAVETIPVETASAVETIAETTTAETVPETTAMVSDEIVEEIVPGEQPSEEDLANWQGALDVFLAFVPQSEDTQEEEEPEDDNAIEPPVLNDPGDYLIFESEPNNDVGTADYLSHDYSVYATVSYFDPIDYYMVVLSQRSRILAVSVATQYNFMNAVMDANENILAVGTDLGYDGGYYGEYILCELDAGIYYIACTDTNANYNEYMLYLDITPVTVHTHSYTSEVTHPTCVAQGYTTYICSCGDSYKDDYTPATGKHTYTDDFDTACDVCGGYREGRSFSNPVNAQMDKPYKKAWKYDPSNSYGIHYVKFALDKDGVVTFQAAKPIDYAGNACQFEFIFYDENRNSIYGTLNTEACADGSDQYVVKCGLPAGTYYISAQPKTNGSYGTFYGNISLSYKLSFYATDYYEKEPNGYQSYATTMNLGSLYTGYYGDDGYPSNATNYDQWKFSASKDRVYRITLAQYDQVKAAGIKIEMTGVKDLLEKMEDNVNSDGSHYGVLYSDMDSTWYIKLYDYEGIAVRYGLKITDVTSSHAHDKTSEKITPPTCTEQGSTTYTCSCGKSYKDTFIDALGHDYENTICTRCGVADPDAPDPAAVTRVKGSDRHETAFKIANMMKEVLRIEKFDTIIIASGVDSADALAGSYLAAMKQAPILLSRNNSHPRNLAYIQENLSANGIVYILGGTGAVPQAMEDLLILHGIRYERVKGSDRFGTNIEILKKAGGIQGSEILVSTAYNFADSLSASATGKPILLVNSKKNILTNAQKAYLAEITANGPKTFTIIGGTGAVSDALAAELSAYGTVNREKGATREATSVRVAEVYFQNPDTVFLAYSRNFPDGLCGGPLAYIMKAPLLLVNNKQEGPAKQYVAANGITHGYILGGSAAVSAGSAQIIFGQ